MRQIITLLSLSTLVLTGCITPDYKPIEGVFNLNDVNFKDGDEPTLDDEWEFYWKQFPIENDTFSLGKLEKRNFIQLRNNPLGLNKVKE
ncbi:MAG: hypothetical protein HRT57_02100 [Crocinitomicaceae bacterium]|nr:hypothetical protein [Crocinitomicaceae bacterium]